MVHHGRPRFPGWLVSGVSILSPQTQITAPKNKSYYHSAYPMGPFIISRINIYTANAYLHSRRHNHAEPAGRVGLSLSRILHYTHDNVYIRASHDNGGSVERIQKHRAWAQANIKESPGIKNSKAHKKT